MEEERNNLLIKAPFDEWMKERKRTCKPLKAKDSATHEWLGWSQGTVGSGITKEKTRGIV